MKDNGGINFELQGMKQVQDLLKNLPKSVTEKVQSDLNAKAAKMVQDALKNNSPDGNNTKKSKNKLENNVIVTNVKGSKSAKLIGFRKRVFYVKFIELSTKVRKVLGKGKYKSGNRGSVPARPFVLRTHLQVVPKIIAFLNTNYMKVLADSIKRQNKKVLNALRKK